MKRRNTSIIGLLIGVILLLQSMNNVSGILTQHIQNPSFETGSGATATNWNGNFRLNISTGARTGDFIMKLNTGHIVYQESLDVDTDDFTSLSMYIRKTNSYDYAAGLTVTIYYSGGSSDSDNCYTFNTSWSSCIYDGQVDGGKTIIKVKIEANYDYTQLDDVKLYSGAI